MPAGRGMGMMPPSLSIHFHSNWLYSYVFSGRTSIEPAPNGFPSSRDVRTSSWLQTSRLPSWNAFSSWTSSPRIRWATSRVRFVSFQPVQYRLTLPGPLDSSLRRRIAKSCNCRDRFVRERTCFNRSHVAALQRAIPSVSILRDASKSHSIQRLLDWKATKYTNTPLLLPPNPRSVKSKMSSTYGVVCLMISSPILHTMLRTQLYLCLQLPSPFSCSRWWRLRLPSTSRFDWISSQMFWLNPVVSRVFRVWLRSG